MSEIEIDTAPTQLSGDVSWDRINPWRYLGHRSRCLTAGLISHRREILQSLLPSDERGHPTALRGDFRRA
jgi:hypothetical protein